MSHADILDIDRGHIFRKHRHKNNKKVAVIYEKTVKNRPLLRFLQAGCYGARTFIARLQACVTRKALRANGSARTTRSLTLHDKPRQDVDWKRIERGWRYPGGT